MYPILAQWGPLTLYSFGLMVALALGSGFYWAFYRLINQGLLPAENTQTPRVFAQLVAWVLGLGVVGAKLAYALFFWFDVSQNPGILLSGGGWVWYGGLMGGMVGLAFFSYKQQQPFWALADGLSAPLLLALALGRIGCLLAGCCYGAVCKVPWLQLLAVHYPLGHPTYGLSVYPTPLLESLGAMALMALIVGVEKLKFLQAKAPVGLSSALFLIGYGLLRFVLEYFRGDRLAWLGPLSASQGLSLWGIAGGLGLLVWVFNKNRKDMT